MGNDIKSISQRPSAALDWEKIAEAQGLLTELHGRNPGRAVKLGKELDTNPLNVDEVIREAEEALGLRTLTQTSPERSGVVIGASKFRSRAVDPSPVPLQNACDNLGGLSYAQFAALRMAGQTTGSDFRGEVLFPAVMQGIKELV